MMICRLCQCTLAKHNFLQKSLVCHTCLEGHKLLHTDREVAFRSQMRHLGRATMFAHDYDFVEVKQRYNIPYDKDEFFMLHPDGKFEIKVTDWTGDFLKGRYVA